MTNERCKTVIVYGDHGPEEREPVEDYYAAPQQPAGEAVAWEWERFEGDGFIGAEGGYWEKEWADEYPQILHQEDLSDPTKYRNLRPLYTTPADSAPLVEAIVRIRNNVAGMVKQVPDEWADPMDELLRDLNTALAAANGGA